MMRYLVEERINRSVSFEFLLSEISSDLVNVPLDQSDSVLNESLQKIINFYGANRAVIWQLEKPRQKEVVLTHSQGRGGTRLPVNSVLTADAIPWLYKQYLRGEPICYSQIKDLPQAAAKDKITLLENARDHAGFEVPFFNGKSLLGILGLVKAHGEIWPDNLERQLRPIADILAITIMRKRTQVQLQEAIQQMEAVKTQLEHQNVYLRQNINVRYSASKMVYRSEAMEEVMKKAKQVASTNATVLIFGETGTGKEMLASTIHSMSPRRERTMVRVNCGAIPATLVESEMFGREKGAYTGALTRQIGRFELANDSTIFLDEITELPLELQVKLLRVLQEKEIERLGNPKPISINVRVIAATNQNLEKLTRDGKFRDDLFYRLNVFPIHIPPLRERPDDIPLLVWSIVDELSSSLNKKIESISQKSMEELTDYPWPGNVRELRNTIERAIIVCNSPHLTIYLREVSGSLNGDVPNLYLKEMQVHHIRRVLESTSWRIRGKSGAAEILGMKPTTLETRMAKLGILRPKIHRQPTN